MLTQVLVILSCICDDLDWELLSHHEYSCLPALYLSRPCGLPHPGVTR